MKVLEEERQKYDRLQNLRTSEMSKYEEEKKQEKLKREEERRKMREKLEMERQKLKQMEEARVEAERVKEEKEESERQRRKEEERMIEEKRKEVKNTDRNDVAYVFTKVSKKHLLDLLFESTLLLPVIKNSHFMTHNSSHSSTKDEAP